MSVSVIAYGNALAAPTGALTAVQGVATGGLIGNYQYVVTFNDIYGESLQGPAAGPVSITGTALLSAIPLGPPYTLSRNVYRTVAGGTVFKLLTTISGNVVTTFTDAVADGSLGAQNPPTIALGDSLQIVQGYEAHARPTALAAAVAVVAVASGAQPVLNANIVRITTCPLGGAVTLMPIFTSTLIGMTMLIRNDGLNPCLLNPSTGQTINGAASLALANGAFVQLMANTATNWQQVQP